MNNASNLIETFSLINWMPMFTYMFIPLAFTSISNGNVFAILMNIVNAQRVAEDGIMKLHDESSRILQTGLTVCDGFAHAWDDDAISQSPT